LTIFLERDRFMVFLYLINLLVTYKVLAKYHVYVHTIGHHLTIVTNCNVYRRRQDVD